MRSIRTRLLVWVGVVLALGVTAFATAFFNLVVLWVREDLIEKLDNRVIAFAFSVNARQPAYEARFDRGFRPEVSGLLYVLYDTNGVVLGRSTGVTEAFGLSEQARAQPHPFVRPFREDVAVSGGVRFHVATYPVFIREEVPHSGGKWDDPGQLTPADRRITAWAQVGAATSGLHDRVLRLRLWLLAASAVLFGGVLACVYYLAGQWLRSLRTAAETAERLSDTEIARLRLVAPSDEPELVRLTSAFNRLLDRLNASHLAQQRLVADASHELRTPLTILQGEIQVALRRDRSPERYRDVLVSNLEEISRLCRIVEKLLALARADAGEALVKRVPVDLGALAEEVCARFASLAEAGRVKLRCERGAGAVVAGDPFALESIVTNLIENAVRYSPPDESVQVQVSAAGNRVTLEVADQGAGIAPEHLPRLFERFYRVDKARSRRLGGAGLGLAIVKTLVEAHGGLVEVQSAIGVGSTFTVRLPRAVTHAE